jgi:hypothetical protein
MVKGIIFLLRVGFEGAERLSQAMQQKAMHLILFVKRNAVLLFYEYIVSFHEAIQ